MRFSYNKLWKLLIDRGIKKKELSDKIGLSSSALTSRFNQDNISIDSLLEICDGLDVCMDISFSNKDDTKLS